MSCAAVGSSGSDESAGGTSPGTASDTGVAGTNCGGHSNCIFSDDGTSGRWSDGSVDNLSMGDGAEGGISGEGDSDTHSDDDEGSESVSKNEFSSGVEGNGDNGLGTFISVVIAMSSLRVTSCVEDAQV